MMNSQKNVDKPGGPAPAATQTRAWRDTATGADVATVPACAPNTDWKI